MGQYVRNPPELSEGDLLGRRFKLCNRIDGINYGEIWEANVETETPLREVTLRIEELPFSHDLPESNEEIESFLAAFDRANKLPKCRYIPQVISSELDIPKQRAFHVFEALRSRSINSLVSNLEIPFETEVAISFVEKLLNAIEIAHENGILHLVLGPDAILVNENYEPRVIDFAVMPENRSSHTQLGLLVPLYASVAQLRGHGATEQDDIYSLGCLSYLVFTGELPYGKVISTEAAISGRDPYNVESLNTEANTVLSKSVALDAENRWSSVADFKEAFVRCFAS